LSNYAQAYKDLYKAAVARRDSVKTWTLAGKAAEGAGDKKRAASAYRRALKIRSDYKPAYNGLQRVRSEEA